MNIPVPPTPYFVEGMQYERSQILDKINRMRTVEDKQPKDDTVSEIISFVLDHLEQSIRKRGEIDDSYYSNVRSWKFETKHVWSKG